MNSYALAFGILGGGVVLAGILWLTPVLRLQLAVRRFRTSLDNIDHVASSWSQGLRLQENEDLRATAPEDQTRRRRDGRPEDPGPSLV